MTKKNKARNQHKNILEKKQKKKKTQNNRTLLSMDMQQKK